MNKPVQTQSDNHKNDETIEQYEQQLTELQLELEEKEQEITKLNETVDQLSSEEVVEDQVDSKKVTKMYNEMKSKDAAASSLN
ncbi:hypothetical protein LC087_05075 [Bacillus carboniphilus]|uniref:Uncharacterized protein n=1 Tax=Bacillus carboniphilus TaxID=86663 RepID=A0ABY9JVV6_9BACI|nr:hypothetical protein [Bacillus carboniphilus]WLR43539.1 hypothetical protein LC087_05075 [Bacillus carboniphilus]